MQTTAKLRHLRMSPRKVRLVADGIRGRDVSDAINQLNFMNKRVARPLLKLLNSAIANAENNFKLKRNNLYIEQLRVDEGATLKRWMPRAMGRATPINKRTSHISIILNERGVSGVEEAKKQVETFRQAQAKEVKGVAKGKKREKKKIDKDVKIVKSLEEVKELEKEVEKVQPKEDDWGTEIEEHKPEIKDVRREGSDRYKQHLDSVRQKKTGKSGILKRMFRRKSI